MRSAYVIALLMASASAVSVNKSRHDDKFDKPRSHHNYQNDYNFDSYDPNQNYDVDIDFEYKAPEGYKPSHAEFEGSNFGSYTPSFDIPNFTPEFDAPEYNHYNEPIFNSYDFLTAGSYGSGDYHIDFDPLHAQPEKEGTHGKNEAAEFVSDGEGNMMKKDRHFNKSGHDITMFFPTIADDFEEHPNFVHPDHAEEHFNSAPTECLDPCAEIKAERDALAAELLLYKVKYEGLQAYPVFDDKPVEHYYGNNDYDHYEAPDYTYDYVPEPSYDHHDDFYGKYGANDHSNDHYNDYDYHHDYHDDHDDNEDQSQYYITVDQDNYTSYPTYNHYGYGDDQYDAVPHDLDYNNFDFGYGYDHI